MWKLLQLESADLYLSFSSCSFLVRCVVVVRCCSVARLSPTLCDLMDCSMPGFPVLHHLLELAQTHVHWAGDAIQPSHPLLGPTLPAFSISQHQDFFPVSQFFAWGGQNFGTLASASVPPMNIQDWFPLGLTGSISLHSKGLSTVFSNITVQKHQFFGVQPSLWSNSHIHTWLLEKPYVALTRWTFVGKVMSLLFNMLSMLVIAFLSRSKRLLISRLQSPSAVILEPKMT